MTCLARRPRSAPKVFSKADRSPDADPGPFIAGRAYHRRPRHFASSVIRVFLADLARPFSASGRAPVVVVDASGSTPRPGRVAGGAMAANLGWRVIQLGAVCPPWKSPAPPGRAGAGSRLEPGLSGRRREPAGRVDDGCGKHCRQTSLLVGGRAMPAYREVLVRLGAVLVEDLAQLGRPGRAAEASEQG